MMKIVHSLNLSHFSYFFYMLYLFIFLLQIIYNYICTFANINNFCYFEQFLIIAEIFTYLYIFFKFLFYSNYLKFIHICDVTSPSIVFFYHQQPYLYAIHILQTLRLYIIKWVAWRCHVMNIFTRAHYIFITCKRIWPIKPA